MDWLLFLGIWCCVGVFGLWLIWRYAVDAYWWGNINGWGVLFGILGAPITAFVGIVFFLNQVNITPRLIKKQEDLAKEPEWMRNARVEAAKLEEATRLTK